MDASLIRKTAVEVRLDDRQVEKRIGLIALATDHTTERDFVRMCPHERAGVYCNRILNENPTTPENLRRMQPRLREGAELILPEEPLDVIYYSCTSASAVLGNDTVVSTIQAGKPDTPVVTPTNAADAALRTLGARRISIVTPYIVETSAAVADYFSDQGYEVASVECFGMEDDRDMARINLDSLFEAGCAALSTDADALFMSCTALPSAQVAQRIEDATGKPVVTSNQAGVWLSLHTIGLTDPIAGYGRLLTMAPTA